MFKDIKGIKDGVHPDVVEFAVHFCALTEIVHDKNINNRSEEMLLCIIDECRDLLQKWNKINENGYSDQLSSAYEPMKEMKAFLERQDEEKNEALRQRIRQKEEINLELINNFITIFNESGRFLHNNGLVKPGYKLNEIDKKVMKEYIKRISPLWDEIVSKKLNILLEEKNPGITASTIKLIKRGNSL